MKFTKFCRTSSAFVLFHENRCLFCNFFIQRIDIVFLLGYNEANNELKQFRIGGILNYDRS